MEQAFTVGDLWQIIIAICGAIITVSGAITIIVNAVTKAKEPNKKQNERLNTLEKDVKEINNRLDSVNEKFFADRQRMDEIDKRMTLTTKVIVEGLQALTSHAIDGNNIDELKEAKKTLENYLLDQV